MYTVEPEFLPTDATQQREQLVRRLGAEDSSIDIIGMDVIWTGEFANAGWVEEITGRREGGGDQGRLPERDRVGLLRGRALRRPVQHQHAVALVPQGPRQAASEDLGSDDRRGRAARTRQLRHDPGPGTPLRGLHGLGERADRERRHPDPLRARAGRPGRAADVEGARGDGPAWPTPPPPRRRCRPPTRTFPGSASSPASRRSCSITRSRSPAPKENAPDIAKNMGFARFPEVVEGRAAASPRSAASTSASAPSRRTRTSPSRR